MENYTISKQQIEKIIDTIKACAVFITPMEKLKSWNEFKQDAANRLNDTNKFLENITNK